MDAMTREWTQVIPELTRIDLVAPWAAPKLIPETIEDANEEPCAAEHTE